MNPLVDFAFRGLAIAASSGGPRGRLSILIYHRVLPAPDPLNNWDPTVAQFDRQMRLLARSFNVLPLEEAAIRLTDRTLPASAACVTFDDGYADNRHVALPCLARHGIHATFFIATGYLDGGRMWNDRVVESVRAHEGRSLDLQSLGEGVLPIDGWDQRRAAVGHLLGKWKHLPPVDRAARVEALEAIAGRGSEAELMMRTEDVVAVRQAGMSIGAHTVTHPILAGLDERTARSEMVESRDALTHVLGEPVTMFAYPNGKPGQDFTDVHVRMAREVGFRVAVATTPRAAAPGDDTWQLPRFTPWQREPLKFGLGLLASRRGGRTRRP